jgi:hypothetical protein
MFWSFWKGLAKRAHVLSEKGGCTHKRYTLSRHKVPAHPRNVLRHGPQPTAAGFVKESIMKTTKALHGLLGRVICPGTFKQQALRRHHTDLCAWSKGHGKRAPEKTGSKSSGRGGNTSLHSWCQASHCWQYQTYCHANGKIGAFTYK